MMTRFSFYIPSLFVCSLNLPHTPPLRKLFIFSIYQYFNDDGLVFSAAFFLFPFTTFSILFFCLYLFRILSALLQFVYLAASNVFYEQWSSLGGSFWAVFSGAVI